MAEAIHAYAAPEHLTENGSTSLLDYIDGGYKYSLSLASALLKMLLAWEPAGMESALAATKKEEAYVNQLDTVNNLQMEALDEVVTEIEKLTKEYEDKETSEERKEEISILLQGETAQMQQILSVYGAASSSLSQYSSKTSSEVQQVVRTTSDLVESLRSFVEVRKGTTSVIQGMR